MAQMLNADSIIYQDSSLLVINKPAEIHSVSNNKSGFALANALLTLLKGDLGDFSEKPENGFLQRLDYETSGIMLVAKTLAAFKALKAQFQSHEIKKEYYALTDGLLSEPLRISGYLGSRHRHSHKASYSEKSKKRFQFAETEYFPVKTYPQQNISIIKACTSYGRRHQVRLMAARLNHPLCGDVLYGSKTQTKKIFAEYPAPAFILHANSITFKHPVSKKSLTYTGSPPEYLVKML